MLSYSIFFCYNSSLSNSLKSPRNPEPEDCLIKNGEEFHNTSILSILKYY